MVCEKPTVACVIITYKRECKIVERALKSVVKQTYPFLDIVVVNDCPEDINLSLQLQEMTKKYEGVRYISYDKNSGACVARNSGAIATKGKYIAFLDDDDEWVENKIEIQVQMAETSNADLVYSPFYLVRGTQRQITNNTMYAGNVIEKVLAYNFIGGTSVPLIKRSTFETVGRFDEKLLSSQDYDLWIRIAENGKVQYVESPTIIRYFSNDSVTTNLRKKKQGWERVSEKYNKLFQKYPNSANKRLNNIVNQTFSAGQFRYGFSCWVKALDYKLMSISNIVEPTKGILKFILKKNVTW